MKDSDSIISIIKEAIRLSNERGDKVYLFEVNGDLQYKAASDLDKTAWPGKLIEVIHPTKKSVQ